MRLKDDPKAYAIMGCAMRVHDTLYHVINSDGWGSRYRFTASRFSTTINWLHS